MAYDLLNKPVSFHIGTATNLYISALTFLVDRNANVPMLSFFCRIKCFVNLKSPITNCTESNPLRLRCFSMHTKVIKSSVITGGQQMMDLASHILACA